MYGLTCVDNVLLSWLRTIYCSIHCPTLQQNYCQQTQSCAATLHCLSLKTYVAEIFVKFLVFVKKKLSIQMHYCKITNIAS